MATACEDSLFNIGFPPVTTLTLNKLSSGLHIRNSTKPPSFQTSKPPKLQTSTPSSRRTSNKPPRPTKLQTSTPQTSKLPNKPPDLWICKRSNFDVDDRASVFDVISYQSISRFLVHRPMILHVVDELQLFYMEFQASCDFYEKTDEHLLGRKGSHKSYKKLQRTI